MTARSEPSNPRSGPGASSECDGVETRCQSEEERCAFDIDIGLVDHSDDKILTPLRVFDHDELAATQTDNQAYVKFEIEVEENAVDWLQVEITVGRAGIDRRRVYYEELEDAFRRVGIHEWRWDGYSEGGYLDTKVPRQTTVAAELFAPD